MNFLLRNLQLKTFWNLLFLLAFGLTAQAQKDSLSIFVKNQLKMKIVNNDVIIMDTLKGNPAQGKVLMDELWVKKITVRDNLQNLGASSGLTLTLPIASTSTLGGIKVGTGLAISSDGLLNVASNYSLPFASATVLGGIKIGSGLIIDASTGVLSTTGGYTLPIASASALGGVKVGPRLSIDANGVLSADEYALPVATATTLGAVKVGIGLFMDNGVLKTSTASSLTLGGIRVGTGLSANTNGVLTIDTASTTKIGGVKTGSGLSTNPDGVLNIDTASATKIGGIKVGTGLAISNGVLSSTGGYTLPTASASTLGGVKVGSGLAIDVNGILSSTAGGLYTLPIASASTLGGFKVGSGLSIDASTGVLTVPGSGTLSNTRINVDTIFSQTTAGANGKKLVVSDTLVLKTLPQGSNASDSILTVNLSRGGIINRVANTLGIAERIYGTIGAKKIDLTKNSRTFSNNAITLTRGYWKIYYSNLYRLSQVPASAVYSFPFISTSNTAYTPPSTNDPELNLNANSGRYIPAKMDAEVTVNTASQTFYVWDYMFTDAANITKFDIENDKYFSRLYAIRLNNTTIPTNTNNSNFWDDISNADLISGLSYAPATLTIPETQSAASSTIPTLNNVNNHTVAYTMSSSPTSSAIVINATSGVISINTLLPAGTYTCSVTATNIDNPSNTSTTTFNIVVTAQERGAGNSLDNILVQDDNKIATRMLLSANYSLSRYRASVQTITSSDMTRPNVIRIKRVFTQADWNTLFPVANSLYSYDAFLQAASRFPKFCDEPGETDSLCKMELAYMFGHFAQETGLNDVNNTYPTWRQALYHVGEMGCPGLLSCSQYQNYCAADANPNANSVDAKRYVWGCGNGALYYGRGPKQLSYPYNYAYVSKAFFGDYKTLTTNPNTLATDPALALFSAMWFYMMPQMPKPSSHEIATGLWRPSASEQGSGYNFQRGFGVSNNVMNGGWECGPNASYAQQSINRQNYYKQFARYFGIPAETDAVTSCATQTKFDNSAYASLATKTVSPIQAAVIYGWNPWQLSAKYWDNTLQKTVLKRADIACVQVSWADMYDETQGTDVPGLCTDFYKNVKYSTVPSGGIADPSGMVIVP